MNDRLRKWIPLGAGLLLVVVLGVSFGLLFFSGSPLPRTTPAAPTRSNDGPPPPPAAPTSMVPGAVAPVPTSRPAEAAPSVAESGAQADGTPSLELANPLPQQNDPIEPEQPQTAEWKHGKLVRITEVLTRDVERLETELQAARGRGETGEVQRLEVQIARHRARLGTLREETAAQAKAAQEEARRP